MKEAYYFSHDANARNDEKILELRADLGWEGYGIFWAIIECLREATDYKYSLKKLNGLALHLSITRELLEKIIFNYELFDHDDEFFWSESLLRRMNKRKRTSNKMKKIAAQRWNSMNNQKISDEEKNFFDHIKEIKNSKIVKKNDANTHITHIGSDFQGGEILCENDAYTQNLLCESDALKEKKINKNKINKNNIYIYNSSSLKPEVSKEGELYANFFKSLLPPTQKITEADLKKWAITFDKLVRVDKRTKEEIYAVTEWARKNEFWGEQGNFLSACKLRRKNKDGVYYYDVFLQKYLKERRGSNGKANEQSFKLPNWITTEE